ncbi:unnamed protein product [Cladocopium goreaui]|uniref:Uncharacterized protein n=1 Tax=Cladocopium goreaui TaxID=2562237 RepID=A0A9P1BXD3_9DINO|nr:unnamed protein product [Cladocopium goreaui]
MDQILSRLDMVNVLASMVSRSTEKIRREIAVDLGYGYAEPASIGAKRKPVVSPLPTPAPPAVGARPSGQGPIEAVPSIQVVEASERKKWGLRLQNICERAGAASGLNDAKRCAGLLPAEAARLKSLAFEAGGFRTIRQNVRYWEKFEEWSIGHGLRVYPPTIVAVMSYALHLRDQGCGPSILPAFKYALGRICKRLVMQTPNMADPQLKAIIDEVYNLRGKELKEAVPVPPKMVFALELLCMRLIKEKKDAAAIFVWWVLILIYASLRFDDGIHVAPLSLQMNQDALLGVVWQTKVERKKRGTRFAVPACSMSDHAWLEEGWKIFQPFISERDYFIWEIKNEKEFSAAPISYSRGLAWLKHFMLLGLAEATKLGYVAANEVDQLEGSIQVITWHSMRVTMLSEAVKANVDDKIVGLQELSVAMVKQMASKLKDAWLPDPEKFVIEEDEEVTEPIVTEFIVKATLPEKALVSADFRQIFGRMGLPQALCRSAADGGLLSAEIFAMLGDTAQAVKTSLRTMIAEADLGTTDAARELALMQLAAVWHACHALQGQFATRRARMEEDPNKVPEMAQEDHAEFRARFVQAHPDVILLDAKEPHKKFVEKLSRDFLVHGMVPYYSVAEIRTRSDSIVQKSGLSKNAEDLLTISKADEPDQVTDSVTMMNRIHAFFMALEYLNICTYSRAAGPLRYLQELEQFRSECPGLPYLLAADSLIRKKVNRLQAEQRQLYGTFEDAIIEVLNNHKYLWNDARTKAVLSKVDRRREDASETGDSQDKVVEAAPKSSPNKDRKKRQRLRNKALLREAKESKVKKDPADKKSASARDEKVSKDKRIPDTEWKAIVQAASSVSGPKRCHYFNSTMGEAGLTQAIIARGIKTLPPIEILANEFVVEEVDILDPKVFQHLCKLIRAGCIFFIHFGTPCSSFSQARKDDGGPPPLRDRHNLWGRPKLSRQDQARVELGNQFMELTVELLVLCCQFGVHWALENPASSFLWDMPPVRALAARAGVGRFILDMCRFQSKHKKPTALLSDCDLSALALACDLDVRPHVHEPLVGMVLSKGKKIFKTKLAQVYPPLLCQAWAKVIACLQADPLAATFQMAVPAHERKRPLGQPLPWVVHKQRATAEKARDAGYQLKRSALPPLLQVEMEPGQAVQRALQVPHPFTLDPALDPDLQEALAFAVHKPHQLLGHRQGALQFWADRAERLLPLTDQELRAIHDPYLRSLLRGAPDDQPVQIGTVTHVALWRELLAASRCIDSSLVDEMINGFSIVGDIKRSFRWPQLPLPDDALPEQDLVSRAWEFSNKVLKNVKRSEVTENTSKIWEATMEDVREGVTAGPFFSKDEVDKFLGTEDWIPTHSGSKWCRRTRCQIRPQEAPALRGPRDLRGDLRFESYVPEDQIFEKGGAAGRDQVLSPGQAGKLRGKLMFGASQLWGKIGRAFLRALSERQYTRSPETGLNLALKLALKQWELLIDHGPPRPITASGARPADYVIFTDGSFPDQKSDLQDPWIGGVLFKKGARPIQFGCKVGMDLIEKWIPRKSQIAMVELFATVVALQTFKPWISSSWSLLFVDSATAKLHHRGPENELPELGRGGGSLAAAIDGALESEVPTVSFVQASAEHRGRIQRSQSSRKAMLKAQQEL